MDKKVFMQWVQQRHVSIPQLLLAHYTDLRMDEQELVMLLHIQSSLDKGDAFPTPEHLSTRMTLSLDECTSILGQLIKKRLLSLESHLNEEGIVSESYTLEPLWSSLITLLSRWDEKEAKADQKAQEGQLYQRFEQEFARPLSPIESETLSMWYDQDGHSTELIFAALREAVISGKLNFRYIDRILFEWKRNGVRTVNEARTHSERFRKKTSEPAKHQAKQAEKKDVPGFHWLEKL
ncbi:DnaD domain-containing protein [Shouchella lonarensis]|uniref:DNA replication protein DnaD n=1 Tax=Shouchella lonarensis TaxID=1464122 RepID=A0A1G6HCS3_9BACI|nr:DnaD domain-containing protein [Shouchella lonarensis]SDB91236.1 DNA replication protein DnaD [Shouchella lonarensis]